MKLSDYAKTLGVSYKTAWRMWQRGELNAVKLPSGTIIVNIRQTSAVKRAIVYTRVSSSENKSNLDSQAKRVESYCIAKGYQIVGIVKEVGSGVNDHRKQLIKLLEANNYDLIVVEHKDRLTRVGFNYIQVLLKNLNKEVEVINLAEERKDDLMQDFVSIITSFCARLYSLRRRTRKTECLINCLEGKTNETCTETLN